MTELTEQDLTGAHFEGVDLRGVSLAHSRLRGVEVVDVDIYGELQDVVVNGVDIAPLVEAELDRRMPERTRMRPDDSDGFREAWAILERLWEGTVARARTFPEEDLHRSVDGEWSFIQTLRHLGFATAAWVGRTVLGDPAPWHPWDLPWDEAPGWAGIPWDRDVRPSLDEVLAVRHERQALVRRVMESLTDEQLGSDARPSGPGWPPEESSLPVAECLRVVLNEEWEHRLYAERDLTALQKENR